MALLILLGLLVDIASVCILGKSKLEAALTIAANALIFFGVWGELAFERIAKRYGDRLVTEANARAAEAQLELARLKAPRSLDEAKRKEVSEKMRLFAGMQFDLAVAPGDSEAAMLADQIEGALAAASLAKIGWIDMGPFGPERFPITGETFVAGVVIAGTDSAITGAVRSLASALRDNGIAAAVDFRNAGSANAAAIHVMIGRKPL